MQACGKERRAVRLHISGDVVNEALRVLQKAIDLVEERRK